MRAYLGAAGPRVQAVLLGLWFGAFMAAWDWFQHHSWASALTVGVISALLFGPLMAWHMWRDARPVRDELAALPHPRRRAALQAIGRGPAPADPQVRGVALAVALHNQNLVRRRHRFGLCLFSALTVLAATLALTGSPWWWAAGAVLVAALLTELSTPRRLDRRIAVLSGDCG